MFWSGCSCFVLFGLLIDVVLVCIVFSVVGFVVCFECWVVVLVFYIGGFDCGLVVWLSWLMGVCLVGLVDCCVFVLVVAVCFLYVLFAYGLLQLLCLGGCLLLLVCLLICLGWVGYECLGFVWF